MTRSLALFALCAGIAGSSLWCETASAQSGQSYYNRNKTVIVTRDEDGRRRTRIVINRRSYLDGGTEIMPGERHFTDYANPPYWSPYGVLGPGRDSSQSPLPDAMDLNKLGPRIGY